MYKYNRLPSKDTKLNKLKKYVLSTADRVSLETGSYESNQP